MTDVVVAPGEVSEQDLIIFSDAALTMPRDLTGAHVVYELCTAPSGGVVRHGTATIASDPTTGAVRLVMDTTGLAGTAVYWIVVTLYEADGTTTNVLTGRMLVTGLIAT